MQIRIFENDLVCPAEGWAWPDVPGDSEDVTFSSTGGQTWTVRSLVTEEEAAQSRRVPLRTILAEASELDFSILAKGIPLAHWRTTHRFCGRCGSPTVRKDKTFVVECSSCKLEFWPRITPAVIALVHRGEKILLARHRRSAAGFFSCLAGFVEVGETLEQTVRREIREEVGLEIADPVYRSSQSWPFPSTLMLAFRAESLVGEPVPDGDEILEAAWFSGDELPNLPPPFSVARRLVDDFFRELS